MTNNLNNDLYSIDCELASVEFNMVMNNNNDNWCNGLDLDLYHQILCFAIDLKQIGYTKEADLIQSTTGNFHNYLNLSENAGKTLVKKLIEIMGNTIYPLLQN